MPHLPPSCLTGHPARTAWRLARPWGAVVIECVHLPANRCVLGGKARPALCRQTSSARGIQRASGIEHDLRASAARWVSGGRTGPRIHRIDHVDHDPQQRAASVPRTSVESG